MAYKISNSREFTISLRFRPFFFRSLPTKSHCSRNSNNFTQWTFGFSNKFIRIFVFFCWDRYNLKTKMKYDAVSIDFNNPTHSHVLQVDFLWCSLEDIWYRCFTSKFYFTSELFPISPWLWLYIFLKCRKPDMAQSNLSVFQPISRV